MRDFRYTTLVIAVLVALAVTVACGKKKVGTLAAAAGASRAAGGRDAATPASAARGGRSRLWPSLGWRTTRS